MKLFALSKAWIRTVMSQNRSVDVRASGPAIKLPLDVSSEPIPTRRGRSTKGSEPYYESDLRSLYGYYYAYRNSPEYHAEIVYADVINLKPDGLRGIQTSALRVDRLRLTLEPVSYRLPPSLQEHARVAWQHFQECKRLRYLEAKGEWENNFAIRINRFSPDGQISCARARYSDQVGTNLTMDWESGKLPKGTTIRNGLERPIEGRLPTLESSVLANSLGVAVMFLNQRLMPLIRMRSDALASITKRGYHCTASGVGEIDPNLKAGPYPFSLLANGMVKEIRDELGLEPGTYELYPVAFARELPRGGHPQLFFVALSLVDDEEFRRSAAAAEEAYEYVDRNGPIELVSMEAGHARELFTYEGWASLHFASAFIEANEASLRERLRKHTERRKRLGSTSRGWPPAPSGDT